MDAVELSSYAGLVAIGLLTSNILIGLLLSTRYNPLKRWPHRKIDLFQIHNWTGYAALSVALLHPFLLLFSSTAGFHLLDLIYPIHSPSQPTENTIGAIALYLLIFVVVTSYFRGKLGFHLWKKVHYVAYASAIAFYTHGLLTDPNLKNTPLDPFDAEKLYIELCALAVLVGTILRVRRGLTVRKKSREPDPKRIFHLLKITKVERETRDSASLYLEVPEHLKSTFQYQAGQYVTLRPVIEGQKIPRSYSFSSSPVSDSFYRVTVKKTASGKVSPYLVDQLRAGSLIEVYPPIGKFSPRLDPAQRKHYVLIAGGSGVTPLLSILKTVLVVEPHSQVSLLYGSANEEQTIFFQELVELCRRTPDRLRITHVLMTPEPSWKGPRGLLTRMRLTEELEALGVFEVNAPELEFFICGPSPMMEEARLALIGVHQIPPSQVHFELFKKPELDPEVITAIPGGARTEKEDAHTALSSNTTAHEVEVVIHSERHSVKSSAGESILEGALRVGLDAPYSCQAGICSTCRAKLVSGKVEMKTHDGLTEFEVEQGYILTCQAKPLTRKVTINYDL